MEMMHLPKLLVNIIHLGYLFYLVVGEDLRLVGNLEPYEGRLEVYRAGEWGSICIDGWNSNTENAAVACKQLRFSGGSARPVTDGEVGPGRFWMDDVICQGLEDQLSDCAFNGWDIHDCDHALYQDIYLVCEPAPVLRLIGGDNLYEGRLEISIDNSVWLSVCNDGWTKRNSEVACRQIGLSGGSAKRATERQSGTGEFWDIGAECVGNESRIDDCVFNRWDDSICSHTSPKGDVYLTCLPEIDGVLRLERGRSQFSGRLEVWYEEEWGTVCRNFWKNFPQNAEVACKQLGYSGGNHRRVARMVNLMVKFWIDGLRCRYNEPRISDCMFNGWGNENCYHSLFDDVFLICEPKRDGAIRLIGGSNQYEGKLEVYVAGEWGGVCINRWDEHILNAHVACRQLGLTGGVFRHLNISERGKEIFWMDNVECRGDEINLGECSFTGWGVQSCAHYSNGVYLTCNPNKGDIQLVGGNYTYGGKVSLFLGGSWKYICGDSWTDANAVITCRQLGLNGGIASTVRLNADEYVWDVHFNCGSRQKLLVTCPSTTSTCMSYTAASVVCDPPVTYGTQCQKNERCEGNAICVLSNGVQKCLCEDNGRTYWDRNLHFCIQKSVYGQVCALNMSSCESNLRCMETTDISRCACEMDSVWIFSLNICVNKVDYNENCVTGGCNDNLICLQFNNTRRCACNEDQFWNRANATCDTRVGYNETCLSGGCKSNLMCLESGNATQLQCACNGDEDQFWNSITNACNIRIGLHAVCNTALLDQCTGNLECRRNTTDMTYRCQCALDNSFWDVSTLACQSKRFFNESCSTPGTSMCDSNLVCLESVNSSRCLCENGSFWDKGNNSCNTRLGYNTTCYPNIPDQCVPGLVCRGQALMYSCLCSNNTLWDAKLQTCTQRPGYNETCDSNDPDICHSNLLCQNTTESSRCLCSPHSDLFWEPRNSYCTMRLPYDAFCVPLLTECMGELTCLRKDGEFVYRCACADYINQFWNTTTNQCQRNDTLLAIYVPDDLRITDAIEFCDVEYSGRLASQDDFKILFFDCVEFLDDIWLGYNTSSEEEHSDNDRCLLFYSDLGIRSVDCSQTHNFVCVTHGDKVTETCKDFPLMHAERITTIIIPSRLISAGRTDLLWWILAAALTLLVIGVVIMAIIFRRREYDYNQWRRRKSLLGTSKVVHNELYNPRALDNDNDRGPTSPITKIRRSLFNTSKRIKHDPNIQSKSSKTQNVKESENPNAIYAVVNKKKTNKGKLNSRSPSVSDSAVSQTEHIANNTIDKSGDNTQGTKEDNSNNTQFNDLYDSFVKSVSYSKTDNTYGHLHTVNDK